MIEREAPGLAEAMRAASAAKSPHAMLSRARAGIRGVVLIVNLPGSPKAAVENLEVIAPALEHAVQLLQDNPSAEAGHCKRRSIIARPWDPVARWRGDDGSMKTAAPAGRRIKRNEEGSVMIDVNDLRKGVTFEMDAGTFQSTGIQSQQDRAGKRVHQGKGSEPDHRREHRQDISIGRPRAGCPAGLSQRAVSLYRRRFLSLHGQRDLRAAGHKGRSSWRRCPLSQGRHGGQATFYKGQPLDVELPTSVDLEVIEAEVAVRGDTATGVSKKVKTETGLLVQCPNFVKVGDIIRVDTRTGEYLTRA